MYITTAGTNGELRIKVLYNGRNFPVCPLKKTADKFKLPELTVTDRLKDRGIEFVRPYRNATTRTLMRGVCGHEWRAKLGDVFGGTGCKQCSKNKPLTQSEVVRRYQRVEKLHFLKHTRVCSCVFRRDATNAIRSGYRYPMTFSAAMDAENARLVDFKKINLERFIMFVFRIRSAIRSIRLALRIKPFGNDLGENFQK